MRSAQGAFAFVFGASEFQVLRQLQRLVGDAGERPLVGQVYFGVDGTGEFSFAERRVAHDAAVFLLAHHIFGKNQEAVVAFSHRQPDAERERVVFGALVAIFT